MAISLTPDDLRNLLAAAMQQAMISVPPTSAQTAPVPSFQNYEIGLEKWGAYMQRLNQHMIAHAVGDPHKKKAYFLSWVGANTYELINKLFSASELDAASFDDVTGKLDEHFKQSVHELAASYTFYQCKMKPGQTYGDWVADLRCIGRDCNFGASDVLDRLIRDMIVLNTPHNEVRRACLRESSPTLEMVLKIANSYIALAASDAIVKGPTQGPTPEELAAEKLHQPEVLAVEKLRQPRRAKTSNWGNGNSHQSESRPEGRQGQRCAGCGSTTHIRAACPFLKAECHKCGRIGHIKSVCRSEQSGNKSRNDYNTSSMSVMTLSKHTHDLSRKPRHALLINGHDVDFEVDTGSPFALIGENVWKNIGSPRLARSRIKLSAYGQRQISVTGECTVDVTCGSTVLPLPLVVVSSGASLLGLNWIQAFQLDINALLYTPKASADLLSADVHTVGVPTDLDQKKAHLQPRDSVQPKFSKARPVPFSRINAVEKELQRLEDLNPWDRVHVNFTGPFLGSMWLLAMDAHSKWPSVIRLANYPTTEITIAGLDALFTIWGLPKTLVSDNGPQFASADFANWCRSNGIVHMTSAPFHPSSNGEAERLVGVFKRAMQRSVVEEGLEKDQAARAFLREYRSTPHSTTGKTPAELMLGRQFRTRLSLLQPDLPHVEKKQQLAKPVRPVKFSNGDHVFIRNYGVHRRVKWIPGRITSSVGTRMFNVQCADGVHRRHVDQMRHRVKVLPTYSQPPVDEFRVPVATRSATPTPGSPRCETPTRDVQLDAPNVASPVLRRSTRDRHPPSTYSP